MRPTCRGLLWYVDFLDGSVDWRRPIAKLESSELSLRAWNNLIHLGILSGCGGLPSGRPHHPTGLKCIRPVRTMSALFFALGRVLGIFCAHCCFCRRSWPGSLPLGMPRTRFRKVLGKSQNDCGAPQCGFFVNFGRARARTPHMVRPSQNIGRRDKIQGFVHVANFAREPRNHTKSALWDASRACLKTLGWSMAPLGHVFGALGLDFGRLWKMPGWVLLKAFDPFCMHSLAPRVS